MVVLSCLKPHSGHVLLWHVLRAAFNGIEVVIGSNLPHSTETCVVSYTKLVFQYNSKLVMKLFQIVNLFGEAHSRKRSNTKLIYL